MATIVCFDCGATRRRVPSNTRYCKHCRILRSVAAFTTKGKTCAREGCGERFVPTELRDPLCGKCNAGKQDQRGHCNCCGGEDYLEWAGLAVCKTCARDPKHRGRIVKGMRKHQQARREENAGGPPPGVLEATQVPETAEEADI